MQTGSSISPSSARFVTPIIALMIGALGILRGTSNPFNHEIHHHTTYDLFTWPKYARRQLSIISVVLILLPLTISLAIKCVHIVDELPLGWFPTFDLRTSTAIWRRKNGSENYLILDWQPDKKWYTTFVCEHLLYIYANGWTWIHHRWVPGRSQQCDTSIRSIYPRILVSGATEDEVEIVP